MGEPDTGEFQGREQRTDDRPLSVFIARRRQLLQQLVEEVGGLFGFCGEFGDKLVASCRKPFHPHPGPYVESQPCGEGGDVEFRDVAVVGCALYDLGEHFFAFGGDFGVVSVDAA